MNRTSIPAAAGALALGLFVGLSSSGHAAAPAPTHAAFRHVQVGESKHDVARVLGHGVKFGEGARNQYGKRMFKVYKADETHFALISYFRVKGTGTFRVIDSRWCSHPAGRLGCS